MKTLSDGALKAWAAWLAELPDNVRKVAEEFPPTRKYRVKGVADIGSYYIPTQYDEMDDGAVTLTCAKFNDEIPLIGGHSVFGIAPHTLEAID
jgi:hypothetical protein